MDAPKDTRFLCTTGIMLSPPLALAFELSGALILQQLHYWLAVSKHRHEGFTWVYNTYEQWVDHLHVYSDKTIRNKLKELEDLKVIITGNFNKTKYDRTKWYRIDYEALVLTLRTRLPNWRVLPQPSGNGYQMVLEAVTGPIPKNTQENTQERTIAKTALRKGKTPLRIPAPADNAPPLEQSKPAPAITETLSEKETETMPKEIASSSVLLARLKEKSGSVPRAAQVPNTGASLAYIWRQGLIEHHATGGMVPMFTMAQKGQFNQIARKLGTSSDNVVRHCVQEWIGFAKYVAGAAGLHKTPDLPNIGFMLKYAGEGSAYRAQSEPVKVKSKTGKSALEQPIKPVQLIANPKMKALVKNSPVKSPATVPTKAAQTTPTSVPEDDGTASVEEILAWKPKE